MNTFEIGDRVKVVKDNQEYGSGKLAGEEGLVIEVDKTNQLSIRVRFDRHTTTWFEPNELEKVK